MDDHGLKEAIDWLLLPSSVALITAASFPLLMLLTVGESRPALQGVATAVAFLSGLAWRVRLGPHHSTSEPRRAMEGERHFH